MTDDDDFSACPKDPSGDGEHCRCHDVCHYCGANDILITDRPTGEFGSPGHATRWLTRHTGPDQRRSALRSPETVWESWG